jgi:hypothetical protein
VIASRSSWRIARSDSLGMTIPSIGFSPSMFGESEHG